MISFIKVMCNSALLFVGIFVGLVEQASDALPQVDPAKHGMSAEQLGALDALAQRYVEEGRVAGIVNVLLRNGEVVYRSATGSRAMDGKVPLNASDLFRIYCMTKPIKAAAAMQLYEQGKFHLSDPVEMLVPELARLKVLNPQGQLVNADAPGTMHQLLTHTAGFSYGFSPLTDVVEAQYAKADLWTAKDLGAFAERVAKFQPGSKYHYSIAMDITGLVVERISGTPFDEYLQENIFAPLGMKDTFFEAPRSALERFLRNYFFDPESGKPVDVSLAPPPFNAQQGRDARLRKCQFVLRWWGLGFYRLGLRALRRSHAQWW